MFVRFGVGVILRTDHAYRPESLASMLLNLTTATSTSSVYAWRSDSPEYSNGGGDNPVAVALVVQRQLDGQAL